MKKLLSIILLFLSIMSSAQEFSITDQGNKWGVRFYDGLCDDPVTMGCTVTDLFGYRINGETTINDITYSILERAASSNPVWSMYRFIREEESIIYTYSESEGETILYDFTLDVGDTVLPIFESDCFSDSNNNGLADVTDVSTQFIAGQNRKVITFDVYNNNNFSDTNFEQWIEGIGSVSNLIEPFTPYCDISIMLNCFNTGEELFIFAENEEDCDSLLQIPDISKISTSLTPNPISRQSILSINNFQNNTTLSFYNVLGQQITQKEVTNSSVAIHRNDFPSSGMYFYQIIQDGVIIDTQKFIVK